MRVTASALENERVNVEEHVFIDDTRPCSITLYYS
jgi:hypothetical protein